MKGTNKKVWIGVAAAIVAVVLVLWLSRSPSTPDLDTPEAGAGLVETQSGIELVDDEHLDDADEDYPEDEEEEQAIDEYEEEDAIKGSYEEDNFVEFDENMLIKPADMGEDDALEIGMLTHKFVLGLWDRPPSDQTQYDSFIRMWNKYGCANKTRVIEGFTGVVAPKMKLWRTPGGAAEARTGAVLIDDRDATTGAYPVTVSTAVYYTEAPSVSLFGDPGGEFFTVKRDGDGWCVATQEGLSLDWAKTQQ